ncbi:MAG TPA: NCS2 family permease, partial [Savagea sp.]
LAKVSIDMTKSDRLVGATSMITAVALYFFTHDLVYTILGSVVLSSIVGRMAGTIASIPPLDNEKLQLQKLTINQTVIRGALAMVALNIGANIAFGKINGEIGNQDVNVDHLTVISSLADMVSALFGGAPVEVVISATSTAPHAVFAGVLMMVMMGVVLLAGLLPKIGRFVPSTSIAGFLLVLGMLVTLPNNATAALPGGEDSIVGGVTMAVTALTDPFVGMLAGLITQLLVTAFGG